MTWNHNYNRVTDVVAVMLCNAKSGINEYEIWQVGKYGVVAIMHRDNDVMWESDMYDSVGEAISACEWHFKENAPMIRRIRRGMRRQYLTGQS